MAKTQENYRRLFVFALVTNAALGYASFGYNFSIFNSLQKYIQNYVFPDASTFEISLIASFLSFGGVLGSLIASPIISKWGRRPTMIGADVVGIIGLVLTVIPSLPSILVGRFISGIVAGINTVVVPVYLVEMSPLQMCGASGSVSIIVLETFNFVSLAVSFAVPSVPQGTVRDETWRILISAPGLLNITRLFCLLVIFKYETPFQNIQKRKDDKAQVTLKKIFKRDVESEYKRISVDVQATSAEGSERFLDLFTKKYRKGLFVCLLLGISQHFCGMPVIFTFSNEILSRSTYNTELFSTFLGVVNIISVVLSFAFVEKLPRKSLIVTGLLLLGILTLAFGIIMQLDESNSSLKYLLIIWPTFFQVSLGSLTFLYISEALPPVGVALCLAINWLSAFLLCQFYLQATDALGQAVPFLFFAVFSLVCVVIFKVMLVETKGRTKSEIISAYMGILPPSVTASDLENKMERYPGNTTPSLAELPEIERQVEKEVLEVEMVDHGRQDENRI